MDYEVIGAKRKYKYYKLSFLTTNDDHVKKIKFTNYDKYDRREALKKILDASYVRYKLDADEDMESIESNPLLRNFFVAGQSSYGHMMNTAMKAFVTKDQKLTGTDIRGVNDPRSRVLMESPDSHALFFKDYYKHNNKNPRAKYLNSYIRVGKKPLESEFHQKVEKEKKRLRKKGGNDDNDKFDDNDDGIYKDSEGNVMPSFKINRDGTRNTLIHNSYDLKNFWKRNEVEESSSKIPDETELYDTGRRG